MFSSFSLPFSSWLKSNSHGKGVIDLAPVPIHDVQVSHDRRTRRLRALLKANHANHSVIYHNLTFHNHTPHILGSAYILGGQPDHLNKCYEVEDSSLEAWQPSPGEISKDDWRDYLGKREYQRAYVDFFEDQLVNSGYDWKALVEHYMFGGSHPLVYSVISGLAHPLIHLAYAYELSSQDVGIEALALTACFHDDLHKYLEDPSYSGPASYQSRSPLEILQRVSADERFQGLFKEQAMDPDSHEINVDVLMEKREEAVLDHWNAWQLDDDPKEQFAQAQKAAAALLVGTQRPGEKFDFFLLHTLTSSHAVRILLPLVPAKFQLALVRGWFLFTIMAYVGQQRPKIDVGQIGRVDTHGQNWKHVVQLALSSQWSTDAHYVKGLRALQNAAETWGDSDLYFLKSALKLGGEFNNWGGFGSGNI